MESLRDFKRQRTALQTRNPDRFQTRAHLGEISFDCLYGLPVESAALRRALSAGGARIYVQHLGGCLHLDGGHGREQLKPLVALNLNPVRQAILDDVLWLACACKSHDLGWMMQEPRHC
jgi:hypothetical protein